MGTHPLGALLNSNSENQKEYYKEETNIEDF